MLSGGKQFLINHLMLSNQTLSSFFVFYGTATLFLEIIYSLVTSAKREAILFLFGCSEVNSTWLITSELANQRARKTLFTCVVYTNRFYCLVSNTIEYYSILLNSIVYCSLRKFFNATEFLLSHSFCVDFLNFYLSTHKQQCSSVNV